MTSIPATERSAPERAPSQRSNSASARWLTGQIGLFLKTSTGRVFEAS